MCILLPHLEAKASLERHLLWSVIVERSRVIGGSAWSEVFTKVPRRIVLRSSLPISNYKYHQIYATWPTRLSLKQFILALVSQLRARFFGSVLLLLYGKSRKEG